MQCQKLDHYIDQMSQGEPLLKEEEEEVQRHLAQCAFCRERWSTEKKLVHTLTQVLSEIPSHVSSPKQRVLALLEEEKAEKKSPFRFWRRWRSFFWILLLWAIFLASLSYLGVFIASKLYKKRLEKKLEKDVYRLGEKLKENPDRRVYLEDPWGSPYRLVPLRKDKQLWLIYTAGQNQKDEGGQGDDLWFIVKVKDKVQILSRKPIQKREEEP